MELTVDQALQQGVAAHKEGKLQDAERLYRAILQAQPNHPDANHNLGVLAVAAGKPIEAIPLLKLALETNSQIEQFWLSYIGVLMTVERFDEAKRVLVEGEKSGVSEEKLDVFQRQLEGNVPKDANEAAKKQTLSEKRTKLAEDKKNRNTKPQGASSSVEPSQDQLNHLIEHYQAGSLEEVEELATLLTQQFPNHPFAWKVLGAVLQQTGRVNESLLPMQQSADLSPQDAEAHSNLGVTLKELGRLDDAEASYKEALALTPDHAEAHYNLGVTLQELGKLDDAEASYRQAIALKPDYAEAHSNLGSTLKGVGRLDDAEASYREAIALKPDFAGAHSNLGVTLEELGRLDDAEASHRKAIALKPDFAGAHSNLGNTLRELGRLDGAEASHRRAIALKPDFAEAQYNLGNTLKELGRLDDAEASYKEAIALNPDFADAYNNLGNTLLELGRLDEAEASYRQAIAADPDFAKAHHNLAIRKKFSSKDEQFSQMQALYRDPATSEKSRCHICFALAKAYEDLGEFARAFRLYAEGNALRKKELGYNKAQDKQLFESLKANGQQITYAVAPEIVAPECAPIFIVGMPRSGTTLVEQIISSHPLVTGAGELSFASQFGSSLAVGQAPVNAEALKTFREEYLNALKRCSEGNAVVTDKMPHNFRFLGLILAALPEAKIIHVKRDPAAVCWANYTQYFVNDSLGYCYSLDDTLHYYELYQDLMEHWRLELPNRIYDLHYEVLTENQEEETRKLIAHLGLEWDDTCLSPQDNTRSVATASNVQVRQRVYQGSSEKWKRYEPYLNGALDSLGVDNQ
jgi:tetratricopeptide (TPR) repeat protein